MLHGFGTSKSIISPIDRADGTVGILGRNDKIRGELRPGLEVESYDEAYHQTRQPLSGAYLDWNTQEGLGFVLVNQAR